MILFGGFIFTGLGLTIRVIVWVMVRVRVKVRVRVVWFYGRDKLAVGPSKLSSLTTIGQPISFYLCFFAHWNINITQ